MPSCQDLKVRVTPRADRNAVVGWRSSLKDELLVRVCAAPDDGKANQAVIKILSSSLGIPKSSISISHGHTSREKTLIFDMDANTFADWKLSLPVKT